MKVAFKRLDFFWHRKAAYSIAREKYWGDADLRTLLGALQTSRLKRSRVQSPEKRKEESWSQREVSQRFQHVSQKWSLMID